VQYAASAKAIVANDAAIAGSVIDTADESPRSVNVIEPVCAIL